MRVCVCVCVCGFITLVLNVSIQLKEQLKTFYLFFIYLNVKKIARGVLRNIFIALPHFSYFYYWIFVKCHVKLFLHKETLSYVDGQWTFAAFDHKISLVGLLKN